MSRETILDDAISKAKEAGDWQLVDWLRMARGGQSAARWYTAKLGKLEAENIDLRNKLVEESALRVKAELENAKLRKLVQDMLVERLACDDESAWGSMIESRAAKLGIEVE